MKGRNKTLNRPFVDLIILQMVDISICKHPFVKIKNLRMVDD